MAVKEGAGTLLEGSGNSVSPGASISAAPPTVIEQEVKEVTMEDEDDQETEDEMKEEDYQVMMGIFSQ